MKQIKFIAAALLFIAIFNLPYDYYKFLRIVISIAAVISAIKAFEEENILLTFIFTLVLILFNPIYPIFLNKGVWMVIDIIVAILFGATALNDGNRLSRNE